MLNTIQERSAQHVVAQYQEYREPNTKKKKHIVHGFDNSIHRM